MSDHIDIGALQVPGGYFLLKEERRSRGAFMPDKGLAERDYRHCFTYVGSEPTIKQATLEIVRQAKRKIFITSFRVGDSKLLEALYEAADRMRGGVYLITALDERSLARGLAELDDDAGADFRAQNKRFEELTSRGIYVRGHSSCHAKFIVADDAVALVSSANLETRAFHETGENGVVVTDPAEVGRLARFFARLWQAECDWEVPPGETYTVQKRIPEKCSTTVPRASSGAGPCIIWTDCDEHLILQVIHDTIKCAQTDLIASTFSLSGMTERPDLLIDPLRDAVERGVRVRMLVRARNNVAGHRRDAQALSDVGVEIYADSLNHAKGIIADGRVGALFSANFDAEHGLDKGVEVGTCLTGLPALTQAWRYFEHAMLHADLEFKLGPPQRQMDARLGCRWRTPWVLGERIIVDVARAPEWERFGGSLQEGPVLFVREDENSVLLYTRQDRWRLTDWSGRRAARLVCEQRPQDGSSSDSAAILEQWLSSRGDDGAEKGFCSCVFERISG